MVKVYCAYDEMVDITKLVPNPRNPNRHSDKQIELLAKIIEHQGWRVPITVSKRSGFVVRGHGRLQAAEILGLEKVPVDYQDYASEAEEWADLIADNRLAELSEMDNTMLKNLIQEIDTGEIDLTLTGFDLDEIEDLMNQYFSGEEVEVEEDGFNVEEAIPEEPTTKLGDIWQLGKHRLMCGDSTKPEDVKKLMNGKKADMLFTDPPYGVSYSGGHNKKKREGVKNDELQGEHLTNLFYHGLKNAIEVTADHAAFYVWFSSNRSVETFASFNNLPLKLRQVIVWYKVKSGLGAFMAQYIPNYEPCIYAFKEGCSPQWFGPTDEKNVWELKKDSRNDYHPTQKPIELSARAIRNSSKTGQIILDLFGGSGSTLIACEQMDRTCYMMELDPKYCDVIIKRWEEFTGQKAVKLN